IARASPRVGELFALPGACERLSVIDADLASLKSVDAACAQIAAMLGSETIEALGLNAGVQVVSGDAASEDGIELSFAVNYLAHFLIVERLRKFLHPGS